MQGNILDNKYRILEQIGRGGTGSVYKAEHIDLRRLVAIKRLRVYDGDQGIERLKSEARLLGQLDHPSLVRVYDVFSHEGEYLIVMEYVEGETLESWIRQDRTEFDRVFFNAKQLLQALQVIHSHRIMHRDIKPGNIFVTSNGAVKIGDFGLAVQTEERHTIPLEGTTVKYLAPETYIPALLGERLEFDPRQDIYAAGFTVYELFLGQTRFRQVFGDIYSEESFVNQRWLNWHGSLSLRLPPLHTVRPDVSELLSNIISRMCEKDPQNRYQDVTSIISDFAHVSQPFLEAPDSVQTAVEKGETRKSRKLLYAAGTVSILTTVLLLLFALNSGGEVRKGLLIKTSPPGAKVSVNGEEYGATNARGELLVKEPVPGILKVTVRQEGYESRSEPIVYARGDLRKVEFKLKPLEKSEPTPPPPLPSEVETTTGIMLLIPGGAFLNGEGSQMTSETLPDYYIDKYEVKNRIYKQFCDAAGRSYPENPRMIENYFLGYPEHPVVNVSWEEAQAFSLWAGKRLPTVQEWEKAARYQDGRRWPWGSTAPQGESNLGGKEDATEFIAAVTAFPRDVSPFGVFHLAGNVAEWTIEAEDRDKPEIPVIKGGSWTDKVDAYGDASPVVLRFQPEAWRPRMNGVGFRCAASVEQCLKVRKQ